MVRGGNAKEGVPPRFQPLPAQRRHQVGNLRQGQYRTQGQEGHVPPTTSASCFSGGRRVTCKTPMLNGRNFEKLIVNEIKEKVFAESNIRDMVKLLDEEIKELAGEQGERFRIPRRNLGT